MVCSFGDGLVLRRSVVVDVRAVVFQSLSAFLLQYTSAAPHAGDCFFLGAVVRAGGSGV